MDVRITEDELPGLFRDDDDYLVPFAQIPTAVAGLRSLADRLEQEYDDEE